MAHVQNQICDNCGTILFGMDRAAKVVRDALEIKGGTIKTQRVDPDSKWRQFEFISPYREAELAFCLPVEDPLQCLSEYIKNTEARKRIEREAMLRDGATAEHMDRLTGGTGPNRGPYRGAPPPAAPGRGY